jgi:hypothetical protein
MQKHNHYQEEKRRRRKPYLQPAQEDEEHPPQPEPPGESEEALFDDLPMPKRDRSFSVFAEPHFSHSTTGFAPKTSFSNPALQSLQ